MRFLGLREIRIMAYRLLGKKIKPYLKEFEEMHVYLKKSDLHYVLEEYLSLAIFLSIVIFVILWLSITFVFVYIFEIFFVLSAVIGLLLAMSVGSVVFSLFLIYPQYRLNEIRRNLNDHLPYAATHMATIAGTGVPPHIIFRLIGGFEEYGEVAKVFRKIARDVEVFGFDTLTAMANVANETPSEKLKDLLWGMIATIRSGGDLKLYLLNKAKELMDEQRRVESAYIETLSMLSEIYTALFVAGPILFVIMITIIGMTGGLPIPSDILLPLLIYIGMPVLSIVFIIILDSSKPEGMK